MPTRRGQTSPKRSVTTYALDEGGERRFGHQVVELLGSENVEAVRARRVTGNSSRTLEAVAGSELELPADLVLIAIGFLHPQREGPIDDLGLSSTAAATSQPRRFKRRPRASTPRATPASANPSS